MNIVGLYFEKKDIKLRDGVKMSLINFYKN